MSDSSGRKWTSTEVRAKHAEFLFPSVGTYYEEQVCLDSGKGARLKDLDGRTQIAAIIRIAPPLNVTRAEIDEGVQALDASFAAFAETTP